MNQVIPILLTLLLIMYIGQIFHNFVKAEERLEISSGTPFVDSKGKLNVIGVVTNLGTTSEQVTVGLDVQKNIDDSKTTLQDTTFSKIIYPGKESPFKFKIDTDYDILGKPYLLRTDSTNEPYYNIILQSYSNFPVGENRELIGTLKNNGSVMVHNISVYASVHDRNGTQIDSIESNIIPELKPGEVKPFSAKPDNTIVKEANYFSCAGFDPDAPINTLDLGNGKFLPYGLESVAKISNFSYDNSTDSLSFNADHYNPSGGIVTLSVPQLDNNQVIAIFLDNLGVTDPQISKNGKTITTNIFIPPNEHFVRISGILNQS
ncbi:MAG TPA: FxLYD domain-containing protein [Nitrososphaeraceae archaeon]|nr:FxLYD domain-containing protein [Nitrososphaeraceae archaeon]